MRTSIPGRASETIIAWRSGLATTSSCGDRQVSISTASWWVPAILALKPRTPCAAPNILLEEAGSKLDHICKITVYVTDRADRGPVYEVIGKWLQGVFPVSTGLIVSGFAREDILIEIDIHAVIPDESN